MLPLDRFSIDLTHRLTRCRRSGCSASSWAWSRAPGTSGSPRTCHQPAGLGSAECSLGSDLTRSFPHPWAEPDRSPVSLNHSLHLQPGWRVSDLCKRMNYYTATLLHPKIFLPVDYSSWVNVFQPSHDLVHYELDLIVCQLLYLDNIIQI